MKRACNFFVPGVPAPKGSSKAFVIPGTNRAVVTHDCKRTKPWQADIKTFAAANWKGPPASGAVTLSLVFEFVRPASVSAKKRPHHTVKPDLDKLVRAVKDGLKGVIYLDDAQAIRVSATKYYGVQPGVEIGVYES